MLRGHGGNSIELARKLGCSKHEIIDMSSNVNPLGPPPGLLNYLKDHINAVSTFPEVDGRQITELFTDGYDIDSERALAGNGTTQFIYSIPQALAVKRALIVGPTYSDYADACHLHNVQTKFATAEESKNFRPDINQIKAHIDHVDIVFICNPNNPTGSLISSHALKLLCRTYPQTVFVIDESYLPFVHDGDTESLRQINPGNLIVLISISKIFAIPGLRIGYIVSSAEIIQKFKRLLQPWSVNSLAQLAVRYLTANKDDADTFIEKTQRYILAERIRFFEASQNFAKLNLYPSTTNFILTRLPDGFDAAGVSAQLAQNKILVRNCHNFNGLSNKFFRISLKTSEANSKLAEKLSQLIPRTANRSRPSETRIRVSG
jgi:threonine-phosphate decarboxylase